MIRVVFQFGHEKEEPYIPFYIPDAPMTRSRGLIEFAEEKGGSLSFEDIVGVWFPKRAPVLKELIRKNIDRGTMPDKGELQQLMKTPSWDLDVWKGFEYEEGEGLFPEYGYMIESDLPKLGFQLETLDSLAHDYDVAHDYSSGERQSSVLDIFSKAESLKTEVESSQ